MGLLPSHSDLERAFAVTRVRDFAEANSAVEEAIAIHRTVTRQVVDEWEGFGAGFPAIADATRDLIIKEASRLGLKEQDGFELPPGFEIARFANREEAADDDETEIIALGANNPFVASRCAVLPWLVDHWYGETSRHGTLVIVPIRGMLQYHVIRGKASLLSAKILAHAAHEQFRQVPEENQISPDVFMVAPDGRTGRVAYIDEHGNDVIDTSGLLGEALYGPPPNGLNLPR